jgi:hypothetical protein
MSASSQSLPSSLSPEIYSIKFIILIIQQKIKNISPCLLAKNKVIFDKNCVGNVSEDSILL